VQAVPREGTLVVEFFAAPSTSSAWSESVVAYTSDPLDDAVAAAIVQDGVTDHGKRTGHGTFPNALGVYAANPLAFLVLIVYAALWIVFKPETFEWHAVATLATWAMTLVIQRAEHRDTQAIHAKLDEILHALGDARNEITRMDEKEPEEIEQRREHMRKDD
jgi:low affinity Fe/Cu permease